MANYNYNASQYFLLSSQEDDENCDDQYFHYESKIDSDNSLSNRYVAIVGIGRTEHKSALERISQTFLLKFSVCQKSILTIPGYVSEKSSVRNKISSWQGWGSTGTTRKKSHARNLSGICG